MRTIVYWFIAIIIFIAAGTSLESGLLLLVGYMLLETFVWIKPLYQSIRSQRKN
jgi:hypothetical protein